RKKLFFLTGSLIRCLRAFLSLTVQLTNVTLILVFLFNACGFSLALTQVVKLRALDGSLFFKLYLGDKGRKKRKNALYSYITGRNFADIKGLVCPRSAAGDDEPFEHLNSLFSAFAYAILNIYRVPGLKFGVLIIH